MTAKRADRWELGSEFYLMPSDTQSHTAYPWGSKDYALFGAGRDASTVLLKHGMANRGWKRFWIPEYFCQEVVHSFVSTGIEVKLYPDGPGLDSFRQEHVPDRVDPGDVILIVNYYGMRSKSSISFYDQLYSTAGVEIIEDHTHDLCSDWAFNSEADWCMASLRKTLPVADGGVLWSPRGHNIPAAPAIERTHMLAAHEKLSAMVLKKLYLEGQPVEKEAYMEFAQKGNRRIGFAEPSGISQWSLECLRSFPVKRWRETRKQNHEILLEALADLSRLKILANNDEPGTCPFSAVFVFDSNERREQVRKRLMAANVFPSVLWPHENPVLPNISRDCVDFSRRMLSLHCDMRYDGDDMERVASLIKAR